MKKKLEKAAPFTRRFWYLMATLSCTWAGAAGLHITSHFPSKGVQQVSRSQMSKSTWFERAWVLGDKRTLQLHKLLGQTEMNQGYAAMGETSWSLPHLLNKGKPGQPNETTGSGLLCTKVVWQQHKWLPSRFGQLVWDPYLQLCFWPQQHTSVSV